MLESSGHLQVLLEWFRRSSRSARNERGSNDDGRVRELVHENKHVVEWR